MIRGEGAPRALLTLYDVLVQQSPAIGAAVARAAAYGEHVSAEAGLACLGEIPRERVAAYQPYWAARFHLAQSAGLLSEARAAHGEAIRLARDPALVSYLDSRLQKPA
jgi:RNA polymerase sigma-70 factor (ECF subfamily)